MLAQDIGGTGNHAEHSAPGRHQGPCRLAGGWVELGTEVKMPGMKPLRAFVMVALLFPAFRAYGADSSSTPGKSMNMDEPMPIKMAKPGTKKGDVKKAAEKKEREMKAMMEKESAGGAKK